jgi:hypothetical protein
MFNPHLEQMSSVQVFSKCADVVKYLKNRCSCSPSEQFQKYVWFADEHAKTGDARVKMS